MAKNNKQKDTKSWKSSLEISMIGKENFTDAELEEILNQGEVKATEKPLQRYKQLFCKEKAIG